MKKSSKELYGAAKINHWLKLFGEGNMNNGIERIKSESYQSGFKDGDRLGVFRTLNSLSNLFRSNKRQ